MSCIGINRPWCIVANGVLAHGCLQKVIEGRDLSASGRCSINTLNHASPLQTWVSDIYGIRAPARVIRVTCRTWNCVAQRTDPTESRPGPKASGEVSCTKAPATHCVLRQQLTRLQSGPLPQNGVSRTKYEFGAGSKHARCLKAYCITFCAESPFA